MGFGVQQVQVWAGQFPPPEAVAAYEQVLPGAFDRIIGMAERNQAAAISLNAAALHGARRDTRRGQVLGAMVAMGAIGAAVGCAAMNLPAVALALVGVPVLAVANALINGVRGKRADSAESSTAPSEPDI